jgi:transposase-like protein
MPNSVSFRYFKTSPEIIQLAVMLYVRFPLSLRNVEDLLHERGVEVGYESVRYWWHRFGFTKPWRNFQMFTNTALLAECNGTVSNR